MDVSDLVEGGCGCLIIVAAVAVVAGLLALVVVLWKWALA